VVHSYARVGGDDDRSALHEYRDSNVPLSDVSLFIPEDPFASMSKLPTTAGSPPRHSPPRGPNHSDSPPPGHHRKAASTGQHLKSPSAKKYPKGDGDDEESVSLWHRTGNQSDEESEMALDESLKGIRLVTKPRT